MTMAVSPAPPGRRERKKAQTRKLISDTATRLFIERGFDHVTVKEVADAADVSPTTVFKHFPVKEALVFDEDPEQQAGLLAAVRDRPRGQSVPDALQAHLSEVRMFAHRDHPDLRAFIDLVNGTPALREYERQVLGRHEAALAEAIAASAPGISPVAATALARYVLGALDIARDQPDQLQAFGELMDLIRPGWPAA
jgi:AcrR family transcriptional regulator